MSTSPTVPGLSQVEFNLEDILFVAYKRKWMILLPILILVPLALAIDYRRPKIYRASASFEIAEAIQGVDTDLETERRLTQRPTDVFTVSYIVTSHRFLQFALRNYQQEVAGLPPEDRGQRSISARD